MIRVLFVCLGNICRSPTAEGVFNHLWINEASDLPVRCDSAGTGNYHIGQPPDERTQRAAKQRGIDLSGLRARQIELADFDDFDFILAMDARNLREIRQLVGPTPRRARLAMLLEFAPETGVPEVPDPYYGGPQDFERVLDLTTAGVRGLLTYLRARSYPGNGS